MRFRVTHLLAVMLITAVLPTLVVYGESLWARCGLLVLPAIVGGLLQNGAGSGRPRRPAQLRIYRCPG